MIQAHEDEDLDFAVKEHHCTAELMKLNIKMKIKLTSHGYGVPSDLLISFLNFSVKTKEASGGWCDQNFLHANFRI